ncbi:MAG: TolC family protein [Candidatus Kapabacteria bacterium]|nr:TolC family protein [Candidatus Kapabacteria bacterium]
MNYKIIIAALFIFTLFQFIKAENSDTLTVENCLQIALLKNPSMKISEGIYNLTEASYKLTKSGLLPQISFQSSWTDNYNMIFGKSKIPGSLENYTFGFQATQSIFDYSKYQKLSSGKDLLSAADQDRLTATQNLIMSVYIAYYNYLQSKRQIDVANEVNQQAQEHLRQAQGLFTVGKTSKYDLLKAQTDLSNTELNKITALNSLSIAKVQLENVLNDKLSEGFNLKDNLESIEDNMTLASALDVARKSRPEIISSNFIVDANRTNLNAAWSANLPALNASGGYNWKSLTFSGPFPNTWNIGLTLSLPLFQGFGIESMVDQASANLKIAEATNNALVNSIYLEVQQQYFILNQNRQKIIATKNLLTQAEETMKIAEGRFSEGIGSPLEITDARVLLFSAKTSFIQTLYDYQISKIRLKRSVGALK